MGFHVQILWSKHAGCRETWEKHEKNHEPLGKYF